MAKEEDNLFNETQFTYGGKSFFIKVKDIDTVLPALMQEIKVAKQIERGLKKGKKREGGK
jgi:hypothetical protein